jgi:hypothetical protein
MNSQLMFRMGEGSLNYKTWPSTICWCVCNFHWAWWLGMLCWTRDGFWRKAKVAKGGGGDEQMKVGTSNVLLSQLWVDIPPKIPFMQCWLPNEQHDTNELLGFKDSWAKNVRITMKKMGNLQLALQLNFWITLDICNSLYLYVVNANE